MSARTEVSVIIPVFDGERYLAEALRSVLGGRVVPEEVVVVDDGSTDGGAAIAERFGDPVRVVRQPNRGPARGLREGGRVRRAAPRRRVRRRVRARLTGG